ncbi:WYL domain-containing protein [Pseudoalteromonas sp. G4]|uniref:WYL domain-containing protein n=1 Tax=Pseudoalteromonas sp. G4 TaxID=2992761 RepID=UPI00237D549C|nr:WYL domain-containing protein [Pseudoalteromonas sp. G4]MDE3271528.1 WYL domain-containing protein [Pseudoalteromonas sp. G4]
MQDIKWEQILRFRLIEVVVLWEGRLTTNHLCSAFRIGRQQASRDINKYLSLFEKPQLELDRSLKGYKPSKSFEPHFSQGTVNEYLMLLHQQSQMVETFDFFQMGHAESTVLSVPERTVSPVIVRSLIHAAREQRRVDIDYVSLSNPSIAGRNIVPHTIVNDGFRWHVRAYCELHDDYRDFVLSRFRNEPDLLDKSEHGREKDNDWNRSTRLEIVPNPNLNAAQQLIVAEDYGMLDNCLVITSRNALVKYYVQRFNLCLDNNQLRAKPEAFQLTVKNLKSVQYLLI